MTRSFLSHRVPGQYLMAIALLSISLAGTNQLSAAVALGPVIANAADAKQHQIMMEYQAEQSGREQLRVGKLRYEQKQQRRAAILAGMEAQLRVQQQLIVLPPRPVPGSDAAASSILRVPPVVLAILAVVFLVTGIFLKYLRSQQHKTPS
jgi:hypothetical protein